MNIDVNAIATQCLDAINERLKSLHNLNIVVCGKTGVGKSTLINNVFRENLCTTGVGRPVTEHIAKYTKKDFPLTIYDTRGFELSKSSQDDTMQEILDEIKAGYKSKDVNQCIHCMWYCVNAGSDRFEPEEREWLKTFAEKNKLTDIPIIIVLTKAVSKANAERLKKEILNENLDVAQVIPVLAQDFPIDDEYVKKAYGLDTLIQVMTEVLPEELHDTLQNVQRASVKEKKKRAQIAVAAAASAAFAEGFVPIPCADAAALIPTQITMLASITVIFGLNISKSILIAFISTIFGSGGATIVGRTVASNLLKLVPGVGTVAGGVISGATATTITIALGEAYILLLEAVAKGEMKVEDMYGEKGIDKMKSFLKLGRSDKKELIVIEEEDSAVNDDE